MADDLINFRRFGSIHTEFFTDNMLRVNDFGRCEVLSFHLEEGISHPYTGILNLVTVNPLNLSKIDLNYLYVKVHYNINYIYDHMIDDAKSGDERTVWALIKEITKLPKKVMVNPYNSNEKFYYQYQLTLESPLARIKNFTTIFKNLKIHEILKDLLSRGSVTEGTVYNPLLCELDCSRICDLNSLDTSALEIQRGQEDALSFFNRLLIGYGINYIFEFDEEKGVKLIFSCNEKYKENNLEFNCTNDQYLAARKHSYIYFANDFLQKKSIQFEKARDFAKKLKNSWLSFEMSRTDTNGIRAQQVKNIYKNLCIRKLGANPKLVSQSVEDIRLTPGIVLNSYIDEINSKYIVADVTTDVTAFSSNAGENMVSLKTECLELVDHPAIALLDDKADGDHFEFDSKTEFGSLVHQELANLLSLDNKQSLDIVEAMACAKDGLINPDSPADYAEDKAENNDLFYAIITNNNDNVIIKVHTLIEANITSVMKIMQGQRILVMQKGGAYYLYGCVPQPVNIENDPREGINQEIMNLKKESSISLMTFQNNQEYIYSLLKKGARQVEDAVIVQALENNDPGSHDVTYVNTYNKQVIDLHNDYVASRENYQKALEALNAKYADGHVRLSKYYSNNKLNQDTPYELQDVNKCKESYNRVCEKLYDLAGNIVTDCKINFTNGETKDVIVYDNKDGYKISSANGDFDVTATNITLNATTKITLNAPNIELTSSECIKSQVGFSTVTTTADSTSISTGATINGTIPDEDKNNKGENKGKDASDLISSSFSVASYAGITGTAYNVRFTGNNLLTLTGPLKCGITLGYGAVRVVGSEFKVMTQGRFEQYRNILQATKDLTFDIIQSTSCLKNDTTFKLISEGINDAGNLFDFGVGSLGMLPVGYGNLKRVNQNASASLRGVNRRGDPVTRGERVRATFDILDAIIQTLFRLADWIMVILKRVAKYQEIIYNEKKKKDKNYQKFTLMTPFNDNDKIKRLDQVELYISYIKMYWNILAAGFKASQSAYGFIPSVSEFSVNSTKAEIKAQTITFSHHKEAESLCAPAQGSVEHTLREQMTSSNADGDAGGNAGNVSNVSDVSDVSGEKSDDVQARANNLLNLNDLDRNDSDGESNKSDVQPGDNKLNLNDLDSIDNDKSNNGQAINNKLNLNDLDSINNDKSNNVQARNNTLFNLDDLDVKDEANVMDGVGRNDAGKFNAKNKYGDEVEIKDVIEKKYDDSFDQDDFDKLFKDNRAPQKSDGVGGKVDSIINNDRNNINNNRNIINNDRNNINNNRNIINNDRNNINNNSSIVYDDSYDKNNSFEERYKQWRERDGHPSKNKNI